MAIGPMQLIVLGFPHLEFHGEIVSELERLRDSDTVRVIDALAVHRHAEGEIEVQHLSHAREDEAIELSGAVGALDEETWDVLDDIPDGSSAALLLIEHHWAVPLRDAIACAGGFRLSDGFISPLDLIEIGLYTREEAEELHALEQGATATKGA